MSKQISPYFRVLIIGRANSGKTTILRAVCGTNEEPTVYPSHDIKPLPVRKLTHQPSIISPTAERGYHNINDQLVFRSNPGFIFHDSRGFEAGSAQELDIVKNFISQRAAAGSLMEQLHGIWYCIPTDQSARMFTAAELEFFDKCDAGDVPIIAILTKFDSLDAQAYRKLCIEGKTKKMARAEALDCAEQDFERIHLPKLWSQKYPPKCALYLRNMHKDDHFSAQISMQRLITVTVDALDSDISKLLLVSVQCTNVGLCMKYAVESGPIFKTVQRVLEEGITLFPERAQGYDIFLIELLKWFPTWHQKESLARNDYGLRPAGGLGYLGLPAAVVNDIRAIKGLLHPVLSSLAVDLPIALQVLNFGAAIVIISAKAFWLQSKQSIMLNFPMSLTLYLESGTAGIVQTAIQEAFWDHIGDYNTQECKAQLLQIIMDNQMGIDSTLLAGGS